MDGIPTAGGERVSMTVTASGAFGRLAIAYPDTKAVAFLTAEQLRALAAMCKVTADEVDAAAS